VSAAIIVLSTFTGCLVGGMLPFMNTEVLVLSAAALAPSSAALPLIVAATCGQMLGKVVLYVAARGSVSFSRVRASERVQRVLERIRPRDGVSGALLFASASVGVPPFYVVSIACGAVRVGLARFVLLGTCGRALRMAAVVLLPLVFRRVFP
jgi:membrane protein YqaA with SNARE-associated domain